jgi:hypothetical protein
MFALLIKKKEKKYFHDLTSLKNTKKFKKKIFYIIYMYHGFNKKFTKVTRIWLKFLKN